MWTKRLDCVAVAFLEENRCTGIFLIRFLIINIIYILVPPNIIKDILENTQKEGQDYKIKCSVSAGNPKPLSFQFFYKAKTDPNPAKPITEVIKAMDTAYYNLTKITYHDAGVYTCKVSNGIDEDTFDFTLRVERMSILYLSFIIIQIIVL